MLPLENLSTFLRNIADQIDKGIISETHLQVATEHYVSHLFSNSEKIDEDLAKKYLAMGWYIYQQTEKKN